MKKWLGVALLLVAAGLGWVWLGREKPQEPQNSASTAEVSRRSLEVVVEAAGQVEPIREIEVKSRASGEVLEVLVETGDFVSKGSLLARIDPRDVENAWQQAVADMESASVRFEIADAQRQRMEALKDSEVITVQELETALQAAASARADLVRARTNLQLARERRHDATIRAPADGTVIERTVEPGQIIASAISNVSGGTTLFRMADLSQMQVRANVDESDISQVLPGLLVRVSVDAWPNRNFVGSVHKVEPLALEEQNVTTFPVLVRLDNPRGMLKPGMNAEITVEVERRDQVLAVPNGAVVGMRDVMAAAIALGLSPEAVRAHLPRPGPEAPASGGGGEAGVPDLSAKAGQREGSGTLGDSLDKGIESKGLAANALESKGAALMGGDSKSDDSKGGDSKSGDPKSGGSKSAQLRGRESEGLEAKASASQAAGMAGAGAGVDGQQMGASAGGPGCAEIFRKLEIAGFSELSAAEREQLRRCRDEGEDEDDAGSASKTRMAVVFVSDGAGKIEPRRVRVGLSDWEHSEVISGLEEGQQVMLVSVAQLKKAQAEAQERFRSRMGNRMMPGMGRR